MEGLAHRVLDSALINQAKQRGVFRLAAEDLSKLGFTELANGSQAIIVAFGHDKKEELRDGVTKRVALAFEKLGAVGVDAAENDHSWVAVGRSEAPDALEAI